MRERLVQLRNGRAGAYAVALFRRAQFEAARRSGAVTFDIDGRMGMGAVLTHMTLVLALADRLQVRAAVRCTNRLYASTPGEDWFPRLFERVDPVPDTGRRIAIRNDVEQEMLGSPWGMSLTEGLATFSRHIRFVPFLHDEAAAVLAPLSGLDPLGVHYRGTDKHSEALLVERSSAVAKVVRRVERGGHHAIFLATDVPAFGRELRATLPELPIVSYERPELTVVEGQPIHFSDADGYWKGVDALVNILALARCGAVVRTASFLSGWAKVLNPAQRVLMLNQPYSDVRFPDALIRSDL
ncbi:hypothetical protein [Sphingomonas sp.]|uniref:hypothetical protein n=1 Tax=Sphingomonas sp. TaxID=28214 RepID=UPI002D80BA8B|nr:hypothetical protein [Sphingomonas sp.]HEU0043584.1 hypothetical protein [Sphingomonas sp.]